VRSNRTYNWHNQSSCITATPVGATLVTSGDRLWCADLKLVKAASLVVAGLQHFLLACRPLLVDLTLVAELLGQVVQTLQSAHSQQHALSNPKVNGDRRRGVGRCKKGGGSWGVGWGGAVPGLNVP